MEYFDDLSQHIGRYLKALIDKPNCGAVGIGEYGKIISRDRADFPSQEGYSCKSALCKHNLGIKYELMPEGFDPNVTLEHDHNGFIIGKVYKSDCNRLAYYCGLSGKSPAFELITTDGVGITDVPKGWTSKGNGTYWRYEGLDKKFDPTPVESYELMDAKLSSTLGYELRDQPDDLLSEAKRRYPIGTVFKAPDNNKIYTVESFDSVEKNGWHKEGLLIVNVKECSGVGQYLCHNNKWAEIISTPTFTLPEKWCVKVHILNKDRIDKFIHERLTHYEGYQKTWESRIGSYLHYPQCNLGHSRAEIGYDYTEITFDQFKEHVLNIPNKPTVERTVSTIDANGNDVKITDLSGGNFAVEYTAPPTSYKIGDPIEILPAPGEGKYYSFENGEYVIKDVCEGNGPIVLKTLDPSLNRSPFNKEGAMHGTVSRGKQLDYDLALTMYQHPMTPEEVIRFVKQGKPMFIDPSQGKSIPLDQDFIQTKPIRIPRKINNNQ